MPRRNVNAYNEYMSEYMLKRYYKRREYIFDILGSSCIECGSTENLQVDHIDAASKSFPISKMWSISWNRFTSEVSKCQIMCELHHIEKSRRCGDYKRKGRVV